MPHEADGRRYITGLPEPMSRNICHGVPLAPRINCEFSGYCTGGDVSFAPRNRISPSESPYISRRRGKWRRDRARTERGKRGAASSILSAKRPRTTSVALLRISQMRPWFASGIPWRCRRRLSLASRVICPSLDSAVPDMLDMRRRRANTCVPSMFPWRIARHQTKSLLLQKMRLTLLSVNS